MTQRQAAAVRMIETLDEKYCDKVITYIEFLKNEARQENTTDGSLSPEITSLFAELKKGEKSAAEYGWIDSIDVRKMLEL